MAYEMRGHALPGIKQKQIGANMADGKSMSSAFQKMDPMYNGEPEVQKEDFKQFSESPKKMYSKSAMKKYGCKKCKSAMCMCGAKHKK